MEVPSTEDTRLVRWSIGEIPGRPCFAKNGVKILLSSWELSHSFLDAGTQESAPRCLECKFAPLSLCVVPWCPRHQANSQRLSFYGAAVRNRGSVAVSSRKGFAPLLHKRPMLTS